MQERFHDNRSIALLFFAIVVFILWVVVARAQVMTSTNYQIQFDSVNTGGTDFSTSTNYVVSDTVGELGTGQSTSTNYIVNAGYRQLDAASIAISAEADVTMPSIGGIGANSSQASSSWVVTTDSIGGYELTILASTDPAMQSIVGNFSDYTPATTTAPDFSFSVTSTEASFGYTPEGTDVAQFFLDNGTDTCNTGSTDTNNACWEGFATTTRTISSSASSNHPNGTTTTVEFRAELGTQALQPAGDYQATITVTATAL